MKKNQTPFGHIPKYGKHFHKTDIAGIQQKHKTLNINHLSNQKPVGTTLAPTKNKITLL